MNVEAQVMYRHFVYRGPQVQSSNGVSTRARKGEVVAIVSGDTLRIGWSLCNNKIYREMRPPIKFSNGDIAIPPYYSVSGGDRFDAEMSRVLAVGRAITQNKNSVSFAISSPPTKAELINKGVPQSTLEAMTQVIGQALSDHPNIQEILIYSKKSVPPTAPKQTSLWEPVKVHLNGSTPMKQTSRENKAARAK